MSKNLNDLIAEECAALRAENEMLRAALGNLLARIHRDGGHYIAAHGLNKAVEDAEVQVVKWLPRDDAEA